MTRNLSLDRYDAMHAEKRGGGEVLNAFLGGLKPDAGNIFLRRYRFGDSVQEDGYSYSVVTQAHPLTEEELSELVKTVR